MKHAHPTSTRQVVTRFTLPPARRFAVAVLAATGLFWSVAAPAPSLLAQGVAPGATGTGPSNPQEGESPGQVEAGPDRVIITEVPLEQSVLPTVRPISSAFGLESNILDVPRNVTIISREQLDAISIQDVRDFSKLTSSSYTTSNFGAPANPSIRGFSADLFVNGIRRGLTSNGNGLPINFNSVESVDILKGPAPVIYGPSQYVGGFVNLVTKRPFFDKFQGEVSATVGMYDQYRWSLDVGAPLIKDKLAFRLSYSGEESGSFYDDGNKDTQAVYAALTYIPNEKYMVEFNAEYFQADYVENFGINRPTQDLIDNNRYITGFVGDQNNDGVADNRDVNSGFNLVFPTDTIDLARTRRLLRPGDGSFGRSFNAQIIQTLKPFDRFSIVNNTFFYLVDRNTRSSYYYSEVLDDNYVIENRTEFRGGFDIPIGGGTKPSGKEATMTDKDGKKAVVKAKEPFLITNNYNAGFAARFQQVVAYNDFFNEPANAWDLSAPRDRINYVNEIAGGSRRVPGHGGNRFGSPGIFNGDTNDSYAIQGGVFVQDEIKFGDRFGLLFGGRVDFLYVNFQDPLAPPGLDDGDDTLHAIPNFNVSPSFKVLPNLTTYFTYNYSQSTGVGNGGGFTAVGGDFASSYFHRESELFEGGVKGSFFKDTLFLGAAGFFQTRNVPTQGGAADLVEVTGFEFEVNYQPTRNFYLTAAYTYLDSFLRDQSPFSVQTYPFDQPPAGAQVAGGVLTDTFGVIGGYPVGDYRQPGLPPHLFNALITYKTDFGLGATLGAVVTGNQHLNYDGSIRIPWQYTLDLTAFYTFKNVTARVAFLNLTDEDNFSPPNAVYANDSVVRDLPFRIEGTVKIKF